MQRPRPRRGSAADRYRAPLRAKASSGLRGSHSLVDCAEKTSCSACQNSRHVMRSAGSRLSIDSTGALSLPSWRRTWGVRRSPSHGRALTPCSCSHTCTGQTRAQSPPVEALADTKATAAHRDGGNPPLSGLPGRAWRKRPREPREAAAVWPKACMRSEAQDGGSGVRHLYKAHVKHVERGRAGEELERHDPERPRVHRRLRHEPLHAGDLGRDDLGRGVRERVADARGLADAPREAKVDERPRVAAREEHDVGGLEVAVHPAVRVQVREALGHLPDDLHTAAGGQRRPRVWTASLCAGARG